MHISHMSWNVTVELML